MRQLSNELLNQLYGQESGDPFLMLITLTPPLETIRLCNNVTDITSRGNIYYAFPMEARLPKDDGESTREVEIVFDNTTLELIEVLRTVVAPIPAVIEMVLASDPNTVQISFEEMKLRSISYDKNTVQAKFIFEDFLNTEITSERYTPSLYPGIF